MIQRLTEKAELYSIHDTDLSRFFQIIRRQCHICNHKYTHGIYFQLKLIFRRKGKQPFPCRGRNSNYYRLPQRTLTIFVQPMSIGGHFVVLTGENQI